MQQRDGPLPATAQDGDERRRRDQQHAPACGAPPPGHVARGCPAVQAPAEHQARLAVAYDERAVGQVLEARLVLALRARAGRDALAVELRVDRVGAALTGVQLAPDLAEAVVVLPAAERARAVPGGEGRR